MVFRRSGGFKRKLRLIPVDSTKNIVQFDGDVAANSISTIELVQAVDAPAIAVANQVESGCMVHSIEVHVRVIAKGAVNQMFHPLQIAIYKSPENDFTLTQADLNALGTVARKRWVLHFDQLGVGGATYASPMEWHLKIKLPRSFKKMLNSDRIKLAIVNNDATAGHDTTMCGFALYKWYR